MTELRLQPRMIPGNADQQVAAAFQSGRQGHRQRLGIAAYASRVKAGPHRPELPGDRYMSVTVVAERLNVSHDTVLRCFSGYPGVIDTSEEALAPNKPWQRGKRHRRHAAHFGERLLPLYPAMRRVSRLSLRRARFRDVWNRYSSRG